jgi:HTH-type transcriptional regulator/antitoxin HigA
MSKEMTYNPDHALAPGVILEETLEQLGMKKRDFALRCHMSAKTVSQIIAGKAPITADTAIRFQRVLGVSANIWNNLESAYRAHLAQDENRRQMEAQFDWARRFPLTDLRKIGIVTDRRVTVNTVSEVLDFLGLANPKAWDELETEMLEDIAAKRAKAFKSSLHSVACWLRLAEKQVSDLHCGPYDEKAFRATLSELVKLSEGNPTEVKSIIVEACRKVGVAVAFVGELDKTHIAGATRWLTPTKALIVLSLRHKRDDHFWFSFLHEAGHILLHGKREIFIDDGNGGLDRQEDEANSFASEMLIPRRAWNQFTREAVFAKKDIRQFARKRSIAPGIVVGRLQREKLIPWTYCNDLKQKVAI